MRSISAIIILFALTLVWDIQVAAQPRATSTETREDTSAAMSAVPRTGTGNSFDPSTVAKRIVDEASRLKKDALEWGQKLQTLEADLKNDQNIDDAVKAIDQYLVVLRT